MPFQVFDSGKPADKSGYPSVIGEDWNTSSYTFFQEAYEYACHWLGHHAGKVPQKPDIAIDYSGYGDLIEIRTVK